MHAETQYARSGPVSVAYQVVGEGPTDLILVPGGGTLMVIEPFAHDDLTDNLNPVGAAYDGFSTLRRVAETPFNIVLEVKV